MEASWNRAEFALLDRDVREGTLSVFIHYNLLNWTFGLRGEVDWCWYDFVIELGPIHISFCYWRTTRTDTLADG